MSEMAAPILASVTADLTPGPGAPPDALVRARRAAAIAEITGQQTEFVTRMPLVQGLPPGAAAVRAFRELLTELSATQPTPERVVRREFGTPLSPDPRIGPAPGAGQSPLASLGPFVDAYRRPVFVDVFRPLQLVGVQRANEAQPFLYVLVEPRSGIGDALTLGPGSVWIPASQLASGAPASGYAGLRIKSGMLSFGTTILLGGTPITVPAGSTLTLTLDPAVGPAGSGPGADARAAQVTTPAEVSFTFAPAGGRLSAADDAALTVFGTAVGLSWQAADASYDPSFGRIGFPFQADVSDLTIASSHSALTIFAGTASISGAAWSLPVTIAQVGGLSAASGAGGVALGLSPGLQVQWTGRDAAAECGACVLVAEPGLLAVQGLARAANTPQAIGLWAESTLILRTPAGFAFRFISQASGQESWAFIPVLTATLDQPRTVNNDRLRLVGPALVILFQQQDGTILLVEAVASPAEADSVDSYAIKNLLLKASKPTALLAVATLVGGTATAGVLALQFNLRLLLPILPDPYASNVAFNPRRTIGEGVIGTLSIVVGWEPATPVTIDLTLPEQALGTITVAPSSPPPAAPGGEVGQALAQDAVLLARMNAIDDAARTGIPGPTLLDLSTNVSQFGVSFAVAEAAGADATAAGTASIADLWLQVPGLDLQVVTMPAVQWEPVLTPDQSTSFPSPLTFANSGPRTELAAPAVTLVPIAPRPAIDALLADYQAALGSAVTVRFTLPFGIAALAVLERSSLPGIPSPSIAEVQPEFSAANLKGGDQISIRAATQLLEILGDAESPSLPGAAVQLHNALASGVPTVTTVLTPITDTFNSNFSPTAPNPRVPVTRIDVSGFGESLFSDWRNPADAAAIISKARFDVIVGRVSHEIIQAYSVLYPYAVRVVRTITIERQNGAAMVRHDSGWQAVDDGVYRYPKPDLITHPGVVRGVVAVGNIRDTGQTHTTPDGSELMAVRFDCAVTIENAVAGSGPDGVPARDQLGYVQLTDPSGFGQLAPDQYAELLGFAGTLGGPLDCTIDIGGTGQRMRLLGVGVAATAGLGGPEFAMAAWGSPVLPGGGQWSFLRQGADDQAPQAVDPDTGVPLVRAGPATAAPPPSSPYRFADPVDLLQPDNPATDYAILHATGTQRLLFPRPKLEATGVHAITSTRSPVLADPYALGTATGPFPRTDVCIPFPDATYALTIGAGGNLVLTRPSPTFTTPVLKRVLRESATLSVIAYTADEDNHPSVVTIVIDTAAAISWSVNITNVSLATESGTHGELSRVVGTMDGSAAAATQLKQARLVFGPPLQPAASLVSFLEHFAPMPPPAVAMTNDFSVQTGLEADLTKLEGEIPPILVPLIQILKNLVVDLDLKLLAKITESGSSFIFQFELTLKFPTPFSTTAPDGSISGIVAIALAKFQVQADDTGTAVTLQIGGGIGVAFKVAIFEALAYYASTMFLIFGDVFGVGASSLVKGTIDLKVVEVGISIETKIAILKVSCNASDSTIWGVGQVTIAVEITLFFGFDIEFDEQAEWTNNFDGGPCALPNVV